MSLSEKMMHDYAPSVAAKNKLKNIPENFVFFSFEWMGENLEEIREIDTMKVVGAVFREAKTGPNKGRKVIEVKGTRKTAYITSKDIKLAQLEIDKAAVTS